MRHIWKPICPPSSTPGSTRESAGGTLYDKGNVLDDFLRFYLFFSPAGFREVEGRPPLVRRARLGSGEYRLGVGEGLKDRIFEALRLCIDGFLRYAPNGLSPADDLQAARDAGFVLLYRLLFVLYAEDRGLLPYRRNDPYTKNRSLGRFRDDVAAESRSGFARLDPAATGYWQDLKALFALIDDGGARYGVPAYNGGLFDPDRHPFLEANALPDPVVARVIDQLGRAPDPQRPDLGLFRVDYRDLAIQHLGSVYEGMLELRPRVAGVAMRVVRKKQRRRKPAARYLPPAERTIKAGTSIPAGFERTDTVYEIGDVYLETDKGERRATGSYYTPQHVVDHILDRDARPPVRRDPRHHRRRPRPPRRHVRRPRAEPARARPGDGQRPLFAGRVPVRRRADRHQPLHRRRRGRCPFR